MSITQTFSVRTYVGEYLVFKSETLHLPDLKTGVKINISELTLEFVFEGDDNADKPIISHTQPSDLHIKLVLKNFNNPLGTGILEPTKFGTLRNKEVYFTFVTHLIGDKRSFTYTLLTRGE
jgi:hypothetical protein